MNGTIAILAGKPGRITKLTQVAAALLFAGFVAPAYMQAAGLNGNLSLSSDGTETIAVNGTDIDFDFSGTVAGTPPIVTSGTVDGSGDSGLFDITAASTSSFAGIVGSTVTVHDLDSSMQPVGTTTGIGLPLASFITFTAAPTWNITLTEVLAGVDDSGCTGAIANCTPAGSPFNLTDEAGGQVAVAFSFLGTATDGMGNTSSVAGTFSTTFSGTTYQAILADLNAGDAVVSSANATIDVTTIPEPASFTMLLLGSGLLAISTICRRRLLRRH